MSAVILQQISNDTSKTSSPESTSELKIHPPIVVGRGPVLKCGDKRVSRNHATIDWDDDGIIVTSIHVNPTFVNVDGKDQALLKGQSAVLKNGDKFGLLKEAFWFKLLKSSSIKRDKKSVNNPASLKAKDTSDIAQAPKNDVETCSKSVSVKSDVLLSPIIKEQNISAPDSKTNQVLKQTEGEPKKTSHEEEKIQNKQTIYEATTYQSNRERTLPDWMSKARKEKSDAPQPSNDKVQHGKPEKANQVRHPTAKQKKNVQALEEKKHTSSPKKPSTSKKRSPVKNKAQANNKQYHTVSQDFLVSDDNDSQNRLHDVSEDEEEISESKTVAPTSKNNNSNPTSSSKDSCKKGAVKGKRCPSPSSAPSGPAASRDCDIPDNSDLPEAKRKLHDLSDDETEETSPQTRKPSEDGNSERKNRPEEPAETSPKKDQPPRKSCEYGDQCYRKNPVHRKTMAHPGDKDYIAADKDAENSDDDDDRPECEYGIDCYRQNPRHKRDYKHTRQPQPQRQAKRKAKRRRMDDDDDSENEYDFDDPFLNDSSSDDYQPTDSSDRDTDIADAVEEEDTKRMMKEAKKFIKKREK